jgi:hypothetical protein
MKLENVYYTCALCGTQHDTIEARNNCESKCIAKHKQEDEIRKRNEEEKKRNDSRKEIEEILDKADKMIQDHLKEYESLSLTRSYYYLSYIFRKIGLWL